MGRALAALGLVASLGLLTGCDLVRLATTSRLDIDRSADRLPFPEPATTPIKRLPDAPALSERARRRLDLRRAFFSGDFAPLDRAINEDHERLVAGQGKGKEARALVVSLVEDTRLSGIDRCREWIARMPGSYAAHWLCGAMWVEGAWQARTHKYVQEITAAQLALMRERMARARELLGTASKLSPKPVEALTLLAGSYLATGDRMTGESYLGQAEKHVPAYAPIHRLRVNHAQAKWGGSQDAVRAAIDRARAAGVEEEALLALEDNYFVRPWETATPGAEKEYWERVIAVRPTWSRLEALGTYLWRLKRWHEMLPIAERMIRLEPDNPASYYLRANAHENLGNFGAAIADFRMAAALAHELATDRLIRAHLQGHLGLPERDWLKLDAICRYGGPLGVPAAANCLGSAFFEADTVGEPFRKDIPQAFAWHLVAARGGYHNSQHDLGWLLYTGRAPGVSPDAAKDLGIFWLRRAAEQDHEFAKRKLKDAGYSLSEPVGPEHQVLAPLLGWMARNPLLAAVATVVAAIAAFLVAFVAWRRASVARGARQRDEKLLRRLDPIGRKIGAGEPVSPQEVEALAAHPEIRHMLFAVLRDMARPDLLPAKYSSSVAQGESALAYWLMHPNELQDAPQAIEFVETLRRPVDGQEAEFHVYRYRMPPGHWAGRDGWILGLAGPMKPAPVPYASLPGAFSRAGDVYGRVRPSEVVDWYVGMLRHKGMVK